MLQAQKGFAVGVVLAMVAAVALLSALGVMTIQQYSEATKNISQKADKQLKSTRAISTLAAGAVVIPYTLADNLNDDQKAEYRKILPNLALTVVDPRLLVTYPVAGGAGSNPSLPTGIFALKVSRDAKSCGEATMADKTCHLVKVNSVPVAIKPYVLGQVDGQFEWKTDALPQGVSVSDFNHYAVHNIDNFKASGNEPARSALPATAYLLFTADGQQKLTISTAVVLGADSSVSALEQEKDIQRRAAQYPSENFDASNLLLTSYLDMQLDSQAAWNTQLTQGTGTSNANHPAGFSSEEGDCESFDTSETSPYKMVPLVGDFFQKRCLVENDARFRAAINDVDTAPPVNTAALQSIDDVVSAGADSFRGLKLFWQKGQAYKYPSQDTHTVVGDGRFSVSSNNSLHPAGRFVYVSETDPEFRALRSNLAGDACAGVDGAGKQNVLTYDAATERFLCLTDDQGVPMSESVESIGVDGLPVYVNTTGAVPNQVVHFHGIKEGPSGRVDLSLTDDLITISKVGSDPQGLQSVNVFLHQENNPFKNQNFANAGSPVAGIVGGDSPQILYRRLVSATPDYLKIENANDATSAARGDGTFIRFALDLDKIVGAFALAECDAGTKLVMGDDASTVPVEFSYCADDVDGLESIRTFLCVGNNKAVTGFAAAGAAQPAEPVCQTLTASSQLPEACTDDQILTFSGGAFICEDAVTVRGQGGGFKTAVATAASVLKGGAGAVDSAVTAGVLTFRGLESENSDHIKVTSTASDVLVGAGRDLHDLIAKMYTLETTLNQFTLVLGVNYQTLLTLMRNIVTCAGNPAASTLDSVLCTNRFNLAAFVNAQNVGTAGVAVYKDAAHPKTELGFKSIKAGSGVTVTASANLLTISASGGGGQAPKWTDVNLASDMGFDPACKYAILFQDPSTWPGRDGDAFFQSRINNLLVSSGVSSIVDGAFSISTTGGVVERGVVTSDASALSNNAARAIANQIHAMMGNPASPVTTKYTIKLPLQVGVQQLVFDPTWDVVTNVNSSDAATPPRYSTTHPDNSAANPRARALRILATAKSAIEVMESSSITSSSVVPDESAKRSLVQGTDYRTYRLLRACPDWAKGETLMMAQDMFFNEKTADSNNIATTIATTSQHRAGMYQVNAMGSLKEDLGDSSAHISNASFWVKFSGSNVDHLQRFTSVSNYPDGTAPLYASTVACNFSKNNLEAKTREGFSPFKAYLKSFSGYYVGRYDSVACAGAAALTQP